MSQNILELIAAAGSPLDTHIEWGPDVQSALIATTQAAVEQANARWPDDRHGAVVKILLGMHAHGVLLGRDLTRTGVPLPALHRSLSGLTLDSVPGLIIPDDIRDLRS